jgi:hypothetical protein
LRKAPDLHPGRSTLSASANNWVGYAIAEAIGANISSEEGIMEKRGRGNLAEKRISAGQLSDGDEHVDRRQEKKPIVDWLEHEDMLASRSWDGPAFDGYIIVLPEPIALAKHWAEAWISARKIIDAGCNDEINSAVYAQRRLNQIAAVAEMRGHFADIRKAAANRVALTA